MNEENSTTLKLSNNKITVPLHPNRVGPTLTHWASVRVFKITFTLKVIIRRSGRTRSYHFNRLSQASQYRLNNLLSKSKLWDIEYDIMEETTFFYHFPK